MKTILRRILPLSILLVGCQVDNNNDQNKEDAPIQYGGFTLPSAGSSYTFGVDTILYIPSADLEAGENLIWDFSSLSAHYDSVRSYVGYSNPSIFANTYGLTDGDKTEYYVNQSTGVFAKGISKIVSGITLEGYYTGSKTVKDFPLDYGDSKSLSYGMDQKKKTGESISDSIRLVVSGTILRNADSWGSVATPRGEWEVLRVLETENITETIYVHSSISKTWSITSNKTTQKKKYVWIANEYAEPVLELYLNQNDVPTKALFLK